MKKCLTCKTILLNAHRNRKRCEPCAKDLVTRPKSTMTKAEIKKAKRMIGKKDRRDIAKKLGVSMSSLKRAFRGTRLAYYNYCTVNPTLVAQVNKFYEKNGNKKTAQRFGLKPKQVEHIVYRYKMHKPRQVRWTARQIIEATKMAGLVSTHSQAKFFNRPNAFEGSIRSLWMKRFGMGQGCINGLVHWHAKSLVQGTKARYLKPVGEGRDKKPTQFRRLILWVDLEKILNPDCPDFIKEAIHAMANFQRWLWKCDNPKPLIMKMIKERELS